MSMSVEPNELGRVLLAAVGDPFGTLDRVAGHVWEQLSDPVATPETSAGAGPEALIASLITRRLTGFFTAPEPDLTQDRHNTVQADAQTAHYEELLDRNSSVAGALGACDCWGSAPSCPICQGEGIPGWMLPDGELFAAYVEPALTRLTDPQRSPTAADEPDEETRKDNDHDR